MISSSFYDVDATFQEQEIRLETCGEGTRFERDTREYNCEISAV